MPSKRSITSTCLRSFENSSRVSLIDPCLPCRQHSLFSLFLAASLCGPAVISCPSPPLSCDGKRRCVRTNVISFGAERPTPAAAIYDDECRCVSHRLLSVSSPHHRTSSGAESTAQSSLSNFARPAHSAPPLSCDGERRCGRTDVFFFSFSLAPNPAPIFRLAVVTAVRSYQSPDSSTGRHSSCSTGRLSS